MGRVWAIKANFTGSNGTTITSAYGTINGLVTNLEIESNGFRSDTASTVGWELFGPASTPDEQRGLPHISDQYALITNKSGAAGASGVCLRCSADQNDGYVAYIFGTSFANGWIARYDDLIPTLVAFASASPMVGDEVRAEFVGDTIELFIAGTSIVSGVDTTYDAGFTGIYSSQSPSGMASGDDFEAGHMSALVPTFKPKSNIIHPANSLHRRRNKPSAVRRRRLRRILK